MDDQRAYWGPGRGKKRLSPIPSMPDGWTIGFGVPAGFSTTDADTGERCCQRKLHEALTGAP